MIYEERFKFLSKDAKFIEVANELKDKWTVTQKGCKSIFDIHSDIILNWNDLRKYYPVRYVKWLEENGCEAYKQRNGRVIKLTSEDWLEFLRDLRRAVSQFKLPYRCADMMYDFLNKGKIKDSYSKIRIELVYDPKVNELSDYKLIVSPDARLRDVKRIWKEISEMQKNMGGVEKKNQKLRNPKLASLLLSDNKRDNMEITEEILGEDYYNLPGSVGSGEMHQARQKARKRANVSSSRLRKKLKSHTG